MSRNQGFQLYSVLNHLLRVVGIYLKNSRFPVFERELLWSILANKVLKGRGSSPEY